MNENYKQTLQRIEGAVREDIQRQPHLFMRLAENALTVAETFRGNYLKNTSEFVAFLRIAMQQSRVERPEPILTTHQVENAIWSEVSDEVVTFIDGGVGRVEISTQVPILLRVGSYCVRTGERRLSEREQFGYYPVIFGDLQGGSKERKDFVDIVRINAELLGGLAALERTPDLRVLMFHGPLVYQVGHYTAGQHAHTPFTEFDIDLFLKHYASSPEQAKQLKEDFLSEAKLDIYPQMAAGRAVEWIKQRVFEPLAWMAFLYRRLISEAKKRTPVPIIVGAVERGQTREFIQNILLARVFRGLFQKNRTNYFNELFGRTDLNDSQSLLDRLGYQDQMLLALLLQPGEYSEPWEMDKYGTLGNSNVSLPGESFETPVKFSVLKPSRFGFPVINGCYVRVSENTEPVRIEVFPELGDEQLTEATRRVYLYSRLLPGYGFPVGLDVADKYAKVPNWLTNAYSKLIKHHLGVSLQLGEIQDEEMRRLLIQAMYITHRDFLFRPQS
ncbi:MAG: DNA double-strand break repair nuclease NurA [Acidobacteriota bacterium]|nr:DNA double-strand break repair nuclease NurA [Acidobacteriota bacterium]